MIIYDFSGMLSFKGPHTIEQHALSYKEILTEAKVRHH